MRTTAGLALSLLWGFLALGAGHAADWAIVPSIYARTEFNSNLNYAFNEPVSDFIFTLAPAAEFNYTTDIGQVRGRLGLTGMHYLNQTQTDHIDQNYQIIGRYQVAPRWNLSLNTAYIVDSTQQEELLASGLIMTRTPRKSFQITPGLTYAMTERLSVALNYNFTKVDYQAQPFQNYYSQQTVLSLQQQLKNEKTVLLVNVVARESRYPSQDNLFRSLGFNLGGTHKFTPDWEFSLLGGINLSFMDFHTQVQDLTKSPFFISVRQEKVQQTQADPFVNLSITRRWTKCSITGGYSRDQSASAYGSISDNNRLFLTLNYNFTERFSGSLNGEYALANQISNNNSQRSDYLNVGPQVTYRFTEEISLSPGYRFGLRDDLTGGRSAKAQTVWLMINYIPLSVGSEKKPTTAVGSRPATTAGGEKPAAVGGTPFQRY